MKLTWYGHACFKLESSDGSLVFDPYAPGAVPGIELPALEADMVISSHKHSDHYAPEAVTLSSTTPSFAVIRIPCCHDEAQGAKRGKNYITVIESEGLRIAHMGDIGHELSAEQLEMLGKVDVMLFPIGGTYTLDAAEAAELVKTVRPKAAVPMHYRSGSLGYPVLGTLDEFTRFFEAPKSVGSEWIIEALPEETGIFVFDKPIQI